MRCRAVVCIGGSETYAESMRVHEAVAGLSSERGEALIIPTPCGCHSDRGQFQWFRNLYGKVFGFRATEIDFGSDVRPSDVEGKIGNASIIYIPGGNTRRMLERWTQYSIREKLDTAFHTQAHTAFIGSSAGSIYPFARGVSSSVKAENYMDGLIDGLGWFRGVCCPHLFDRVYDFRWHLCRMPEGSAGIGIDACAALIREKTQCTVIDSEWNHVVLFLRDNGETGGRRLEGTFAIDEFLEKAVGLNNGSSQ